MIVQVICPKCGEALFISVDVVAQPAPAAPQQGRRRPPYTGGGDDRTAIREFMIAHFSLEELRFLVEDLGVSYQKITGHNKTPEEYAREAVGFFARRGRLQELVEALRKGR